MWTTSCLEVGSVLISQLTIGDTKDKEIGHGDVLVGILGIPATFLRRYRQILAPSCRKRNPRRRPCEPDKICALSQLLSQPVFYATSSWLVIVLLSSQGPVFATLLQRLTGCATYRWRLRPKAIR
jgi:hypothetical protein